MERLIAVREAAKGVMYLQALPALLNAYITAKAYGAKTEWAEFVPEPFRPDPLARLALSREALNDLALALRIGELGTDEVARLYNALGPEALKTLTEGR